MKGRRWQTLLHQNQAGGGVVEGESDDEDGDSLAPSRRSENQVIGKDHDGGAEEDEDGWLGQGAGAGDNVPR